MDKAKLQERKAQLKAQFDQAVSNANALQGAQQQIDWMIAELDKEEAANNNAAVDAAIASVQS